MYVTLARSILSGSYRELFDPAAPLHAVFPVGFPLILAGVLQLGIEPWAGIKLVIVAFSAIAVFLTWHLARPSGFATATGVALITAISPGVIALSHWELSDVPFWAFTTAALVLWHRAAAPVTRRPLAATFGASLLTAFAYAVRTAGLPLLIASTAWLLLRRRWTQLAMHLLIVVPPALIWWVWSGKQTGYVSQIVSVNPYTSTSKTLTAGDALGRIGENLAQYSTKFLPTLYAGFTSPALLVISVPLLLLALYGWILQARRPERGVAELFFPLYAGVVLLWLPQLGGERILLPMYPLLILYAAIAVTDAARRAGGAMLRLVPPAALAGMLLVALPADVSATRSGTECTARFRDGETYACLEPAWQDFFLLAEYSRDALPAKSVILSRKPALLFATAGHAGRTYPFARDPAALIATADSAGARYLLLDNLDEISTSYLAPALIRRPRAFCVVRSLGSDRATLFGIAPDAASIQDERGDPGKANVDLSFKLCAPSYWRVPQLRDSAMIPR